MRKPIVIVFIVLAAMAVGYFVRGLWERVPDEDAITQQPPVVDPLETDDTEVPSSPPSAASAPRGGGGGASARRSPELSSPD